MGIKNTFLQAKDAGVVKKMALVVLIILIIFSTVCLIYSNSIIKVSIVTMWALYLFTTETFPVDITAMLIMIILIVSGLVTPEQGVSGFSNTATITVLCMFILSAGIEKTGIIQKLGNMVFGLVGNSEVLQLLLIICLIAPLSGFINNTAIVAIFIPMILNLSQKSKIPATKLLIPLSYISMLGGTLTLIGTSTNILGNSILEKNTVYSFQMFEFMKIGFIILIAGILYFLFLGRFLLPNRKNTENNEEEEKIASQFLAELQIKKGSKFIGKTLKELKFSTKFETEVVKIIRGKQSFIKNLMNQELQEDDILVIFANQQRIIELDDRENEKLLLDFDVTRRKMPIGSGKIVKVIVKNAHNFHEKTLEALNFWKRYSASVIGLHRTEKDLTAQRLANIKLKTGEVFLLKVSKSNLLAVQHSNDLMLLEEVEQEYDPQKMGTILAIIVSVIALAAFKILPIMVAALCGVFLIFFTKCLSPNEIYRAVSWEIIFLLAGVIPLGIAMQESGAAELIAEFITRFSGAVSPLIIMGIFYLVTTILTEIISNNAAAVLLIPIGISVADKMHLNPKAFALIVMFAASTSFLSPVGYQTNTMVYGAGNYKFSDFIKVGAPLNIILLFLTTSLIYYFF